MGRDRPWKAYERESAALFGGKRFAANSGFRFDFESACAVGQCKQTKTMPLAQISRLATEVEAEAVRRGKLIGAVCVKLRAGTGNKTPSLVVMTEASWKRVWELLAPILGPEGAGVTTVEEHP